MSPVRIIILVVAAISAIGLAFVVRGMTGKKAAPEAVVQVVEKPMAKVLVASRDLAIGARLTRDDLTWQPWPVDSVNEAYITDGSVELPKPEPETPAEGEEAKAEGDEAASKAEDAVKSAQAMFGDAGPVAALEGAVVREALLKGDPVIERKLVRAGTSGMMAVVLQPGMRAFSIPVSVETAAGGFILPGDRVDVLLTRNVTSGTGNVAKSSTALRNIKVLAIDQMTTPAAGAQSLVGATATLEIAEGDVTALAEANADPQGKISLLLRSYADMAGPSGRTARPELARDMSTVRVWRDGTSTAVATN